MFTRGLSKQTQANLEIVRSPLIQYHHVRIASIVDIACMKLNAISSRGTMRDFIDLYVICKNENLLPELIAFFDQKYHGVKYNRLHVLKSLVYFEDAEKDEPPQMIEKIDWQTIKNYFQKEIIHLLPH